MNILQLKDDFYWIGVKDKDLRVFDIIMQTEFGTTYNSYLLKTTDGIVLFEGVKDEFIDEYIEKINELGSIDEVKYIVCNHTEPDHSGSYEKLLSMNPNIVVVSTMVASRNLLQIANKEFNSKVVKDNDVLKVGNKTLRFVDAINLHWPDTMYTYIEEDKVLVTCDSFGAHYAPEAMLLSKVENRANYEKALAYYTEMIMGPFKPFILKAVDKVKDLDIDIIAPGHGPIIDTEVKQALHKYVDYATPEPRDYKKVVIPYVSSYGYTREIAEIVASVLVENGIRCKAYDLVCVNNDRVVEEIIEADGVIYGSCTIVHDALPPIYTVMNSIMSAYHGVKVASAFGSYGWSGEAVPNILARLKQQKMIVADEGFRVNFKPSEEQREEIKQYALNYLKQL